MPFILINYYRTSLTAAMTSTQTTMDVASTTGLPTLGSGEILPLVLTDAATGQVHEIVYCTGISSSTLTIQRGQEGTAPQAWLSGDYVSCDTTAGTVLTTNSVSATTETLDVTGNGTFGSVSSPLNVVGSGAQVALLDTTSGQATPNKYFESYQGNFVIANSANNAEILSLSDSGNLTIPGTATIAPSAATNQAVQEGQLNNNTLPAYFNTLECNPATASNQAVNLGQSFAGATAQNVASSRALGTVYTNSTGRPIFVAIALESVTSSNAGFSMVINGAVTIFSSTSSSSTGVASFLSCIIPNGATYEVSGTNVTLTNGTWVEVR